MVFVRFLREDGAKTNFGPGASSPSRVATCLICKKFDIYTCWNMAELEQWH